MARALHVHFNQNDRSLCGMSTPEQNYIIASRLAILRVTDIECWNYGITLIVEIAFDQAKRDRTLEERGLDFADAGHVFSGEHATRPDMREDYGEDGFITIGHLQGRCVVLIWTPRGNGGV